MFHRLTSILPLGLDLGQRSVRAVQLKRHGSQLHVHAAMEVPLSTSAAGLHDADADEMEKPQADNKIDLLSFMDQASPKKTEDDSDDWQRLVEPVRKLIQRGGFIGRNVILLCPADRLYMRPVTLPAPPEGLPRHAILGALKIQLANHLAYPVTDGVFDYYPLRHDLENGMLHIMAFTTDSEWIQSRMRLLHQVGLTCLAIDTLPCALSRLLLTSRKMDETLPLTDPQTDNAFCDQMSLDAVLDVGYSGSTLIVCGPNGPLLSRRFNLGGKEITDTIARHLHISCDRAERFKTAYGFDIQARRLRPPMAVNAASDTLTAIPHETGNHELAKTLFAAVQKDLNTFTEGLVRTLNYAINEYKQYQLRGIYLTGGAGHTANLDAFLSDKFDMPVHCLTHPLLEAITAWLPATRRNPGCWTTALGLAWPKEGGA